MTNSDRTRGLTRPNARSALVLTSPIAHRSFDLRTAPERRFKGTRPEPPLPGTRSHKLAHRAVLTGYIRTVSAPTSAIACEPPTISYCHDACMTDHQSGVQPDHLRVARRDVSLEEAASVIAGDRLGEEYVRWTTPGSGVGDPPTRLLRGAFAYRTYDCVPTARLGRLEPIDVLVADGLNVQMRARDIAGVLAIADLISEELARSART